MRCIYPQRDPAHLCADCPRRVEVAKAYLDSMEFFLLPEDREAIAALWAEIERLREGRAACPSCRRLDVMAESARAFREDVAGGKRILLEKAVCCESARGGEECVHA